MSGNQIKINLLKNNLKKNILDKIVQGYRPIVSVANENEVEFFKRVNNKSIEAIDSSEIVEIEKRNDKRWICIILPTYADRNAFHAQLKNLSNHIGVISKCPNKYIVTIIVTVQWKNSKQKKWCEAFLIRILNTTEKKDNIKLYGMTLRSSCKNESLNAVIETFRKRKQDRIPERIGWFDDDVWMDSNCFTNMIEKTFIENLCAVGAIKTKKRRPDLSSSIIYYLMKFTKPPIKHPTGCALIVPFSVIKNGLPCELTEGGFIFFELLDPTHENPFHLLRVAENASVSYYVGAGKGNNSNHIRKTLIDHWMLIASYPEKALTYLRQLLFWGLWPLSRIDRKERFIKSIFRWNVKAIYFILFSICGMELFVRGFLKKPATINVKKAITNIGK